MFDFARACKSTDVLCNKIQMDVFVLFCFSTLYVALSLRDLHTWEFSGERHSAINSQPGSVKYLPYNLSLKLLFVCHVGGSVGGWCMCVACEYMLLMVMLCCRLVVIHTTVLKLK